MAEYVCPQQPGEPCQFQSIFRLTVKSNVTLVKVTFFHWNTGFSVYTLSISFFPLLLAIQVSDTNVSLTLLEKIK